MNGHARLWTVIAEQPSRETLARWKCEAIRLGFNRSVVLRLCFWRWLAEVRGATAWR